MESLRNSDNIWILITNIQFFVLGQKESGANERLLQIRYEELHECRCIPQGRKIKIIQV